MVPQLHNLAQAAKLSLKAQLTKQFKGLRGQEKSEVPVQLDLQRPNASCEEPCAEMLS